MANYSKQLIQALAENAKMELARRHYVDYVELVHHGSWSRAAHLNLVCEELDKVISGETKRLMIFMPPRHGKSMTVTKTFPSYFLGKYPDKRVIEVSYGSELAEEFGESNREKIHKWGKELFGIEVSQTQATKTNWNIQDHFGGMVSVAVGGSITGKGADLLIIDDPIKNRMEAESEASRSHLIAEYQSSIRTRVHAGGTIILILTRWQEDDLAGFLLKKQNEGAEEWKVISLPAICEDEEHDLLHRKVGQALWPEGGYDEQWAEEIKRDVGSYDWASLFQQRPAPAEGGMFKRGYWKYYKQLPGKFEQIVQSWDCTFKDKKESDYVVGQVWGKVGADRYLIDQVRGKMSFTETIQAMRQLTAKYPKAYRKLIENKANGPAVMDVLKHEISGLVSVEPEGGKVVRANAVLPAVEAGNVYLPDPTIAPWILDFVEEFVVFPNGAHDDQVDAMTQANTYLHESTFNIRNLI
ncbi:MAG: phage terminase large subunit [Clostridia bacterium]|nr:phage terminase large subunit [Clostridia bacterium]